MKGSLVSMTYKKEFGDYGENLIEDYLKDKSYEILARNYRKPFGEIDIVAKLSDMIVFVEVKTRKNANFASPAEAVTPSKQRKIIQASQAFLIENNMTDMLMRFDVAEVIADVGEINYIENAF